MGLADPKSRRPWRDVIADLEARHRAQRGPRWHVVQCAPGESDKHACDWLDRLKYQVYYPRIRSMRRVGRKRMSQRQRRARLTVMREVLAPLLPRYVFTCFDLADGRWREIFEIAGVTGIVCENGLPVPVSDDLIARMRNAEVDGAIPGATPAAEVYRLGQLVEIVDGPFAAFRGEIEQVKMGTIDGVVAAVQLTVAINIFGRLTPADLEPWQVEGVDIARV